MRDSLMSAAKAHFTHLMWQKHGVVASLKFTLDFKDERARLPELAINVGRRALPSFISARSSLLPNRSTSGKMARRRARRLNSLRGRAVRGVFLSSASLWRCGSAQKV